MVLRQLRPDAQEHQVAASKAAVAKRSAGAMSKEERQAKRARHMKEVRERQRAARATVAAEAVAAEPAAAVSAADPFAADPSAVESSAAEPSSADPAADPAADPSAAEPAEAEPAEPPEPAAAAPAEPAAAATPPSLQLFNAWLQRSGYEQAEQDEWEEFEDDGAFDDAEPEDLQPAALLEWRGSEIGSRSAQWTGACTNGTAHARHGSGVQPYSFLQSILQRYRSILLPYSCSTYTVVV